MNIEKINDAFVVRRSIKRKDDTHKFLLASDVHFDSKYCDRKLFKKHLKQSQEDDAGVFIFGDFFDLMQGKMDRRGGKEDVRPEYSTESYFDDVLEDAYEFLKPYRKNILMMSEGNHESAVRERHEFDILRRLCHMLNVEKGGYKGFMRFNFDRANGSRDSKTLYWNHGSGGGGVSKGVPKSARRQDYIDADLIVTGHLHEIFYIPRSRVKLTSALKIKEYEQEHVQLGTYKAAFQAAWESRMEFAPPNMGGMWIEFYRDDCRFPLTDFNIMRAK